MTEKTNNIDYLVQENNFLNLTIDFVQRLREKSSFSNTIKEILNFLKKIFKRYSSLFSIDNKNNVARFYWIENDEIQSQIIDDEGIIKRIKNIKKPCTRKRSIFSRKNTLTYFYPFKISVLNEYVIEIPIGDPIIDSKQILQKIQKIIPIIILSIQISILREQLDFNIKETVRILNCNPSGIASIDSKGTILFANQMFEMMTGYSFLELHESKSIINQIFPDFAFVIFEQRPIEGRIFTIKRKDNSEFPCLVSIIQVTEGDETTHILTITDDSYNIRQKEKIMNLRKTIADDDSVGIILFRFSSLGGEIVSEDLRSIEINPEYFASMCYTSIGQGHRQALGVFGPIPAPKIKNYNAIIFAFLGQDDSEVDARMSGNQYYLLSVVFPEEKTEFLIPISKIENKFQDLIQKFKYPNRMSITDLMKFREIVFID